MIAFTIKRREKKDEHAQDSSTNKQFDVGLVLEPCKHILANIHRPYEV